MWPQEMPDDQLDLVVWIDAICASFPECTSETVDQHPQAVWTISGSLIEIKVCVQSGDELYYQDLSLKMYKLYDAIPAWWDATEDYYVALLLEKLWVYCMATFIIDVPYPPEAVQEVWAKERAKTEDVKAWMASVDATAGVKSPEDW